MELKLWSIWEHHSGRTYRITGFSNLQSTDLERFPKTVIYENCADGEAWSRSISDWHESMTLIEDGQ